ncbi:hypothetical protein P8452_01130 [Trifolium repens]|nr:hypothetical protein P8452_01130 [Trifolium repens]
MTANGEMGSEQNKKLPDPPLLLLEARDIVSYFQQRRNCWLFAICTFEEEAKKKLLEENRRIYANEGSSINNHALTLLEAATANFIWQLSFNISTFGAA